MEYNKNNNLDDYIYEGELDEFNMSNLLEHYTTSSNDIISIYNKLDKYMNIIKSGCVKIELTEEQYQRFRFRPKHLSFLLYKTTELWFLLLKVNNIVDIMDFDLRELYIFNSKNLSVINDIFIKEHDYQ